MKKSKKMGRPSKYKPEFCQMLIVHMEQGYSFETFSAIIGVDRDTLYEWAKVYEEFSDSKKQAFIKCQLFWEKMGIDGLWGNKEASFNTGVWVFNMKNRFGWKDRTEVEETPKEIKIVIAPEDQDL